MKIVLKYALVIGLVILSLIGLQSLTNKADQQSTPLTESIARGKLIYADFCITCHLPNGEGVSGAFPPLAKSDYLLNNREASIKAVKYGQQGKITVNGVNYQGMMAPLGLTDQEVADVMNYILNSWGNKDDQMVTLEEVSQIQKD